MTATVPGTVQISAAAVAKLAAQLASEDPDVGGTAGLLGRTVPGGRQLGARQTSLTSLPKVSAEVDGDRVFVDLAISVRWPASVPQVTTDLRERLQNRLGAWTGLTVAEVDIAVTGLVADQPGPRVR
ncbi:hypothetical protein GCM10010112_84530 [Actinoplanes lobatus]|uniref:Putative alkaline shock family protein YloU n=1 Tax=Actinoplanes lobatus TaxID=113568 RepID=A0A7W7HKS7_9ACTN|nr:Asp23/Gls24 family envelope stress response protein [Actinoplanes lobatus]MBB4752354.1 putative alkaline shock family protein YloU [Actinoplanes lobatus]GGN94835.1 hypothetical protein GCM10010112_84530 [Actinoplanes lobatus]GIE45599.1 hypothetical protein Alo02nite_84970 [Actinoplanes lobatus]